MADNKSGKKITILGAGNVGATVAYTFAVAGTCSDIVLIDINKEKAKGEATDIRQGVSFSHNIDGEDAIVFKAGDLRGAIQLPTDVIDAGLEANPRND